MNESVAFFRIRVSWVWCMRLVTWGLRKSGLSCIFTPAIIGANESRYNQYRNDVANARFTHYGLIYRPHPGLASVACLPVWSISTKRQKTAWCEWPNHVFFSVFFFLIQPRSYFLVVRMTQNHPITSQSCPISCLFDWLIDRCQEKRLMRATYTHISLPQ
jgi:hypothetical protein